MAVIRTDNWLKEDGNSLEQICRRLEPYYEGESPREIHRELSAFGLYVPSPGLKEEITGLIDSGTWELIEGFFEKYKKKWRGEDIPIFIFPAVKRGGIFRKIEQKKSGVSYPDKLFLFLPPHLNPNEAEAVFVHEYHHVCRMNKIGGNVRDHTLLDSIVMEGLAEYAVMQECGDDFLADWCSLYNEKELSYYWDKLFRKNLDKKKGEKEHDLLLFGGRGGIPRLIGYSVGFYLVENYYKKRTFSLKNSLEILSKSFFL